MKPKNLDEWFVSITRDTYIKLVIELIAKKLSLSGVIINDKEKTKLEAKLNSLQFDNLAIDLANAKLNGIEITPGDNLKIEIIPDDVDRLDELINEFRDDVLSSVTSDLADEILREWKAQAPKILKKERRIRSRVQSTIYKSWQTPIDLLEALLSLSFKAGVELNQEFQPDVSQNNNSVFEVLIRLHARGCQVGHEIFTLLKNGFADGAQARWRTLHELTVTAYFIFKHGNDTAERYIYFTHVNNYREALKHQAHCKALNWEPISEVDFQALKDKRDDAIKRFGKDFTLESDYGWALDALRKSNSNQKYANFGLIEKDVNLSHFRPLYSGASNNIHAGPKGAAFRLGLNPNGPDILLAGPSIYGLGEPGANTALSINQLTSVLLTSSYNLERFTFMLALRVFMQETINAFFETEARIDNVK